ncbi:MAG: outer membrane protein assembly factor BamE [Pseudomonadota bacterium]
MKGALLIYLLATGALAGCGFVGFPGVYRIDVEQGNLVDREMIDQLTEGMSRRQVRFIMGSPLVEDTFNPDRWDYPYVISNGRKVISEAKVTVHFVEDRLVAIEGDYVPEWSRPPGEAAGEDEQAEAEDEDAASEPGAT